MYKLVFFSQFEVQIDILKRFDFDTLTWVGPKSSRLSWQLDPRDNSTYDYETNRLSWQLDPLLNG